MADPTKTDPSSAPSVPAAPTGLGTSTGDDDALPQPATGDEAPSPQEFLSPRINVKDVLEAEGTGSRSGSPGRVTQGFSRPMPHHALGRVMGRGRDTSSTRTGSSESRSRSRSSRRPMDTSTDERESRYDLQRGFSSDEEDRSMYGEKVVGLLRELDEQNEKIKRLEREIERLGHNEKQIEGREQVLYNEKVELEGKITQLNSEVKNMESRVRKLTTQDGEYQKQINGLDSQLQIEITAALEANKKMEETNKINERLRRDYKDMVKTIEDHEETILSVREENKVLMGEIKFLKEQPEQVGEEQARAEAAPDDDDVKPRRLTKRETFGDTQREYLELRKRLEQAEKETKKEAKKVDDQNVKIKNLEDNLAKSRSAQTELDAAKKRLSQENQKLEKQRLAAQKDLEKKRKTNEAKQKEWELEKEGFVKEMEMLQRKEKQMADNRRHGIQQLNDQNAELKDKISELEDKNHQLQRTLKSYKKGLSDEPIRQSIAKTQLWAEKGIMQNALESLGDHIDQIDLAKFEEGVRLVDDTKNNLDVLSGGGDATRQVREGVDRNLNQIQELLQGPIESLKTISHELEHSTHQLKKEEKAWKEGNDEIVAILRRLEGSESKGKGPASSLSAEFERASVLHALKKALRKMDRGISKSPNPTEAIQKGTIRLTELGQREVVNESDRQLITELQKDLQNYLDKEIGDQNIRDELRELLKQHRRALDENLKHMPEEPTSSSYTASNLEKKIEMLESEQSYYYRKKMDEYGAIIKERPPGTPLKPAENKKLQGLTNAFIEDLPENRVVAFFAGDSPQERRAVGLNILIEKVKRLQLREAQDIHTWLPTLRPVISEHSAMYAELVEEQRKLQAEAESLTRERRELSQPERGRSTISRADMDAAKQSQSSKHPAAEQLRLKEERIRRELRLNSTRLDRLFSNRQMFTHWVENLEKKLHSEAESLVMQVLLDFAQDRLLDKARREACFCSLLEYFLPKVYNSTATANPRAYKPKEPKPEPEPEPPQQPQKYTRRVRHSVSTLQATGRSTTFAAPKPPRTPQPPTSRRPTDFKPSKVPPGSPRQYQQNEPIYEHDTTRHGHAQGHLLISPSLSIFEHYTYPYICQLITALIWLVLLILFQPVNLYRTFSFMTSVIAGLPVYLFQALRLYLHGWISDSQDDIRKAPRRITCQLGKRKWAEQNNGEDEDEHEEAKKVKEEEGTHPAIPILRKAGSDLGPGEGPSSSVRLGILVEEPQQEESSPVKEKHEPPAKEAESEDDEKTQKSGRVSSWGAYPLSLYNITVQKFKPTKPSQPEPETSPEAQPKKESEEQHETPQTRRWKPSLPTLTPSVTSHLSQTCDTLLQKTKLAKAKLTNPKTPRPPSAATILGSSLSIFLVYAVATYLAARAERRVWTGNDIVWKHAYIRDLELSSSSSVGARPSPYASSVSGAYPVWSPARVDFRLVYAPVWWRIVDLPGGFLEGLSKGWEYLVLAGRWIGKGAGDLLGLAWVSCMKGWEYLAEGILWVVGKLRVPSIPGEELGYNPGNWPVAVLAMGAVGAVGYAGWYMRREVRTGLNFLWE